MSTIFGVECEASIPIGWQKPSSEIWFQNMREKHGMQSKRFMENSSLDTGASQKQKTELLDKALLSFCTRSHFYFTNRRDRISTSPQGDRIPTLPKGDRILAIM